MRNVASRILILLRSLFLCCLLLCSGLFSSCEKVIDLKLKESDRKIVIEGWVSYGNYMPAQVKISETRAFDEDNNVYDDNRFDGISGATVTVQVNGDTTYDLTEVDSGIYRSGFAGVPGSTYLLTVKVNGNTYTATSVMPKQVVALDSLWVQGLVFGNKVNLTVFPQYNDPPGIENYYNLVEYRNDTLVKKVFPQNDQFSDGKTVTQPMINPMSDLKEKDMVTVWLQCVDANVYKYWFSLDAASTGNNQSATPTNPVTNIEGGALGYFSAYSVSEYSIRIP